MSRVAWFTPLPPVRSGVAAYSADVLPLIGRDHVIDVFVDRPAPGGIAAHDFVWKHLREPYDLAVYQLGNSPAHDFMWPYLTRYPGLVVLHDGQLHLSRAKALLGRRRSDEYRAELKFSHPDAPPGIADLVIANLAGSLFYHWPMLGAAVHSARIAAVHSERLRCDLAVEFPERTFTLIRMGVADPRLGDTRSGLTGPDVRARLGLPPDEVVFAAVGGVTPEKRIRQIVRALAVISPYAPRAHLVLVGAPAAHYDAVADARAFGVEDRVRLAGYVADDELAAHLDAADVCLCLRWPTTRETSAAWIRCLAAGKATITTDLVHAGDAPSLDARTWTTAGTAQLPAADASSGRDAICVSIDILDEDHSLALAMRRLAWDGDLRAELGSRARSWWERNHTLDLMATDYRKAIARALEAPMPDLAALPPHLRTDGTELARDLVAAVDRRLDAFGPTASGRD